MILDAKSLRFLTALSIQHRRAYIVTDKKIWPKCSPKKKLLYVFIFLTNIHSFKISINLLKSSWDQGPHGYILYNTTSGFKTSSTLTHDCSPFFLHTHRLFCNDGQKRESSNPSFPLTSRDRLCLFVLVIYDKMT